jgi:hypothetical protein
MSLHRRRLELDERQRGLDRRERALEDHERASCVRAREQRLERERMDVRLAELADAEARVDERLAELTRRELGVPERAFAGATAYGVDEAERRAASPALAVAAAAGGGGASARARDARGGGGTAVGGSLTGCTDPGFPDRQVDDTPVSSDGPEGACGECRQAPRGVSPRLAPTRRRRAETFVGASAALLGDQLVEELPGGCELALVTVTAVVRLRDGSLTGAVGTGVRANGWGLHAA